MASKLTCTLCDRLLNSPRMLSCGHTFCTPCLEGRVAAAERRTRLICPTCKTECGVPDGDVRSLPLNVFAQELVNDQERLQREADERSRKVGKCSKHPDVNGQFYCTACEQITCARCVHPDEFHYGHRVVSIDEGVRRVAEEYQHMLEAVRQSTASAFDAARDRKALDMRLRDAALQTTGNVSGDIDVIVRDLELVRVELAWRVQLNAHHVLAAASNSAQSDTDAKAARNATRFCASTMQFVNSATLTDLLKQKAIVQAECDRLVNAVTHQRVVPNNAEREIGILVDNRFVHQLAALKKGARTFLEDEMKPTYICMKLHLNKLKGP
jgi:hypothetical protein